MSHFLGKCTDRMLGARGCLATFHRAAPSPVWERLPNRNFYLDLRFLDRFLSYLKSREWDIVTIEEALRRMQCDDNKRPYINFSVDDCYRDTFETVIPLFRAHRVPVTLFVATGIPDGTVRLWHAGLEQILLERERVVVDGGIRDTGTDDSKRKAFAEISAAWDGPGAVARYEAFCGVNGYGSEQLQAAHAISWEMLLSASQDPLVEIGSHTVSHRRLSALSEADAYAELSASRQRLRERLGLDARHFAFPFGRSGDCGPRDFALAHAAGFSSAATTRKGLVRRGQDPFRLPRITLNGAHRSLAAMNLHLCGVSAALARMSGRV